MIIAVLAAIAWGAGLNFLHLPFWLAALGGPVAAGLGFWLERARITRGAPADRRTFFLVLAAAYAFVAVFATGLVSLSYALVPVLLHR
jgi:hypothetical protein